MHDQTFRPALFRCLSLAALLSLTAWAFHLSAKPAFAMNPPPQCAEEYTEQVTYYNNAQHQTVVGYYVLYCYEQGGYHTGYTSPWYIWSCSLCSTE